MYVNIFTVSDLSQYASRAIATSHIIRSLLYLVRFEDQDGFCRLPVPDEDVAAVRAGDEEVRAPPRSFLYHRPENNQQVLLKSVIM